MRKKYTIYDMSQTYTKAEKEYFGGFAYDGE